MYTYYRQCCSVVYSMCVVLLLLTAQVPGEVADRSGQVKAGDKLLSINMEDISQANQDTVRNLLQVHVHVVCGCDGFKGVDLVCSTSSHVQVTAWF